MAAVLEVFTVPARVTAMAASSGRLCGGSFSIPTARGLRIKSGSMRLRSVAGRSRRKYGAVVCELPNTATEVPSVNEGTWQPVVLEADVLTLVEFWAPWCGPCRMIEPVIAELAVQYAGKLKCFKLNTDESPKIATQYGIRSIPTVILFKNGEKKEAIIGAVPKTTLATSIEKFLPS